MNFFFFSLITILIIQPINAIKEAYFFAKTHVQLNSIAKNKKILLLGDSLAEGMTSTFHKLAKQYGYISISNCLRGSGVQYWSPKIEKIITLNKPDLLVVSLGTNDSGIASPETQRKHIKNIKNVAIKHNVRILWILPQALPSRFKSQNEIKQIIIDELGDNVFYTKNEIEKTNDKIHPTHKGYEIWMNLIWQRLIEKGILNKT
jgi:lysophospholipase L1-like esterase